MKTKKAKQGMAVMMAALLLVLGLVLTGCDNGSTGGGTPPNNNNNNNTNNAAAPSVTNEDVYNNDGTAFTGSGKVYAKVNNGQSGYDQIEIGEIKNGKVTLTFPATVESKYLSNIKNEFHSTGTVIDGSFTFTYTNNITFNPAAGVNVCTPNHLAFVEGQHEKELSYYKDSGNTYEQIQFIYSAGDITIDGTFKDVRTENGQSFFMTGTQTFDKLKLSRGWNTIYVKVSSTGNNNEEQKYTFSVTAPTGLKWGLFPTP